MVEDTPADTQTEQPVEDDDTITNVSSAESRGEVRDEAPRKSQNHKSPRRTIKTKPTKQDKLEANNLLEEASEILENCISCGMCKSLCPVFKTIREESISPRGKAILLKEKILDKVLFQCTLCKACEQECPLNIKVCDAIRKAREAAVLKGKSLASNEEMIKNTRKHGNPFGKGDVADLEKLYCC